MHVVTVSFHVKPEHLAQFMPAMQANAAQSLRDEPGCHQFDVCVALDDPCHVFLYEVYESAGAFQDHLATAHFKAFNDRTAPWVRDKRVATYTRATADKHTGS